jgi:hypothetical protein
MGLFDQVLERARNWHAPPDATKSFVAIDKEIAVVGGAIDRLEAELEEQQRLALRQDQVGAAARVKVKALRDELRGLREKAAKLREDAAADRQRHAAAKATQQRQEALALPAELACRRRMLRDKTAAVEAHFVQAATMLKELQRDGEELGLLWNNERLRKRFEFGAFQQRKINGVAPLLHVERVLPPAAASDPTGHYGLPGYRRESNNLLRIVSDQAGERAHWSLTRFTDEFLDAACRVFDSSEDAQAAQQRLRASGEETVLIALPQDGLVTLVGVENTFGSRASAEKVQGQAAARGERLAVLAVGDGFVLVDERLLAAGEG